MRVTSRHVATCCGRKKTVNCAIPRIFNPPLDPPSDQEVPQHRTYLLRYAVLQTAQPGTGEDAAQENLLAALEGRARFAGGCSLKTWLTGILKHKILDAIRAIAQQPLAPAGDDDQDAVDALFKQDGHWQQMPATWGDPEQALENRKFWEIFELCSRLLPERTARVTCCAK